MFQNVVLFTVLLPLSVVESEALDIFEIETFVDFAKEIVNTEMEFLDSSADSNSAISDTLQRMNETNQKYENFTRTLSSIEYFYPILNAIRPILEKTAPYVEHLHNLDEHLYRIEKFYKSYVQMLNEKNGLDAEKLEKWVNSSILLRDSDLPWALRRMYSFFIRPDRDINESFFDLTTEHFSDLALENQCGFKLSIQQRLLNLCGTFVLNQLKGFVMKVYANTINAIQTKSADKSVFEKAKAEVLLGISRYLMDTKSAMSNKNRRVETCDAEIKSEETFASFKGLMQSIIINQADTSPEGRCYNPCNYIRYVHQQKSCNILGNYCPARPCYGRLDECSDIDNVEICELPAEDYKRYEWYKNFAGTYFGTKTSCHKLDGRGVRRFANSFLGTDGKNCKVCLCVCTDDHKDSQADRTISFRPQIAAIQDNMVLAGIRIISADKVIHIQIKEGRLMSNGRIDPSTLRWKKLEKMRYDNTVEPAGSFDIYREDSQSWEPLKQPNDFLILNGINRTMYLDIITVENEYVLTGARWNYVGSQTRPQIQLEVHATKYDSDTGKLDPAETKWLTSQNMPNPPKEFYTKQRKTYRMTGLSDPLKSPKNLPASRPNYKFSFEVTNTMSDVGQETVPFFDTQPVETDPPIASVGLEVFHRTSPGFGGFIALRLLTVDLYSAWMVNVNADDIAKYKTTLAGELPSFDS